MNSRSSDVPARTDFVSSVVELSFKDSGYDPSTTPIIEPVKSLILKEVLISDEEWENARKSRPELFDLTHVRANLEHFIRDGLEFFPVDYVGEGDLKVIIAALRVKFRPMQACMWPFAGGEFSPSN